jgi:hypothetical protein
MEREGTGHPLPLFGEERSHEEAELERDVTPPLYASVVLSAELAAELQGATNTCLDDLPPLEGACSLLLAQQLQMSESSFSFRDDPTFREDM